MIRVTMPLMPDMQEFGEMIRDIWSTKMLTNNGEYHKQLEKALSEYLKVPYLSLFTNGTLPLLAALQALEVTGEVITTPYSFIATAHALWWNKLKPVFVDVDPRTGNMDPEKIESAVTSQTTAIMPVHVYGNPCDTERIQDIADRYGLKVIYDAAHAFGVEVNGKSILEKGDIATLSFHATKVYNTMEGGALICRDAEMKQRIDYLKNFGFKNETEVICPGINGKMDELRAIYGLLNLKGVNAAREKRKWVAEYYRKGLKGTKGISWMEDMPDVRHNYAYFPVFIDEKTYGISRDEIYFRLKEKGILARRYFYPLISSFSPYRELTSASPGNLPAAQEIADRVICLPMHHELSPEDIDHIIHTMNK